MDSRVITLRGLSEADERAWRDLATRAVEPNPFCEPDCLIPAAAHQSFGASIKLAVAEQDGRFYACVPFRATTKWKFPYPIATSQVRRMGYLGTPLIDAAKGPDAAAALLQAVASERGPLRARFFVLDGSHAEGPVARLVRSAAGELGFRVQQVDSWERGLLMRRPTSDYLAELSGKSRYNLRRAKRKMEEFIGAEVKVVDRSDDPQAIDEYIALEASGYKGSAGIALAAVPGEPEYFRAMCDRFRSAGRLHVVALQTADQVIAMLVWIHAGDGMFFMKISYDEAFARYSPGILLQVETTEHFHDSGARWLDTCTHEHNWTLLRLNPQRRTIEHLVVMTRRSLVDRAVVRAFLALRPLHKRFYLRRHPETAQAS